MDGTMTTDRVGNEMACSGWGMVGWSSRVVETPQNTPPPPPHHKCYKQHHL